jgi:hypothetical protein
LYAQKLVWPRGLPLAVSLSWVKGLCGPAKSLERPHS